MMNRSIRGLLWLAASCGMFTISACGDSGDTGTGSGGGATTGSGGGTTTTGSGGEATTGSGGGMMGTDDPYPTERGFDFDGVWYPELTGIAACGNNGNISTYQVGARTGTNEQGVAAWLFAVGDGMIPAPGHYTTSAYDGAR